MDTLLQKTLQIFTKYITSTANLSEDAQQKVIDLVLEKNYDAAKEIVAASQQRRGDYRAKYRQS